jgi:broad specificity polyphosphatase/5'/3'-nucleotidase SurE
VYTESHKNENNFTTGIFEHEDNTNQVLNTTTKPYYWIGKDYANTYREDFKDIHEFSRGIILRLNKR